MATIIAFVLSFVLVSFLVTGCFENPAKIQQAKAQDYNNNGTLNVGSPQKMTISGLSKPPVLSPEKKQALEQDQAKTHHSPQLPSSDQAILGPILGTQAH